MSKQSKGSRGSTLVAAGILLSRVAGLVRVSVLSSVLGAGTASEVFAFAMRLPNFLQNLLGEGSLSASFIPVYAKLVGDEKEEEAGELAGAVLALLALVTSVLVLVAVLMARPFIWLFTTWETNPEKYELAIDVTRITTIGLGFLVISAWCLGVLNSHRSFFLSYFSPVLWNFAQIGLLAFVAIRQWSNENDIAVGLAWAVLAGGLFQVLVQLPKVRRHTPKLKLNLKRTVHVRSVIKRFVPAVGARGVLQVSSLADTFLAGLIASGAFSWLLFTLPLYLLPISLFGFSVAASELAEMSRVSDNSKAISDRLKPALRRVVIPAGFVTAAYAVAGPTFVDGLYGTVSSIRDGGLEPTEIKLVGLTLGAFSIGLPAAMTARVTQNTLYSLGDVKGPAKISAARVSLGIVVSAVLMLQLDWLVLDANGISTLDSSVLPNLRFWERVPLELRDGTDDKVFTHLGVVGLGLGASFGNWFEWFLLRRRLSKTHDITIASGWAPKVAISAAFAAIAMFRVKQIDTSALSGDIFDASLLAKSRRYGHFWCHSLRNMSLDSKNSAHNSVKI